MVTTYLPIILKEDYEAFQRILHPNLPDTHNEWFYLHAKERADYEGRRHTVIEVEVNPNEFTGFLNARGDKANLHTLGTFTYEKGLREKK